MSDLIERQAAMKPLRDDWQASESRGDTERAEIAKCHYIEISNLPAAQPEIIRCKDCKHSEHWYRDKRRCFLWHEDGIDVFEDGFCNYAERREEKE